VSATYGADSQATLLRKLADPYIKAIRFATDRIGKQGVVCYVNNSSFIAERTFDGLRKHLAQDFDLIYVLDLGGNVRKNPKLSGTTHNVFGIQVGVSINLFIKLPKAKDTPRRPAKIFYHAVPVPWRKEQKYEFLNTKESVAGVKWQTLKPDKRHNWLTNDTDEEFAAFLPIGSRVAKAGQAFDTVFRTYSLGVSTNRDAVVYDFDAGRLAKRVEQFYEHYNEQVARYLKKGCPENVDDFVDYEEIKWSHFLKQHLKKGHVATFEKRAIRSALYRPFCGKELYLERPAVDAPALQLEFFPNSKAERENRLLSLSDAGLRSPFSLMACCRIPDMHLCASTDAFQCFPLFTYTSDGKERRDNVTTKAVTHFRNFYDDERIQRRDIFHYVYAVLHHPGYRVRYAENLKRDLPRIPFIDRHGALHGPLPLDGQDERTDKEHKADAKVFHQFAQAGERLLALHVGYEQQPEFPLQRIESREAKLDWRVETMKLDKVGRASSRAVGSPEGGSSGASPHQLSLRYNDFLTLTGIPAEVLDYRLGNRSALEWVIDQYRVTRDADDNLVSDPNRLDDEQYIVRLLGQVVTVSVETLKTIRTLPELKFP